MNFEVYSYFSIVLAGFITVWMYRHFSKSKNKISDFEYLGWSSFWGLFIITFYQLLGMFLNIDSEKLNGLFSNPFATGLLMSIIGMVGGICTGLISNDLKNKVL